MRVFSTAQDERAAADLLYRRREQCLTTQTRELFQQATLAAVAQPVAGWACTEVEIDIDVFGEVGL